MGRKAELLIVTALAIATPAHAADRQTISIAPSRLGEAVGISREELWSLQHVVPAVRFACDAYVHFAATAPWQEAVCSSLTEMFAPQIHKDRLATWPTHYPWIESNGLAYFRSRIPLASRDVPFAFTESTADFQTVTLQGQLTYRVAEPQHLAALLDFSLHRSGGYSSLDPEKLPDLIRALWEFVPSHLRNGAR